VDNWLKKMGYRFVLRKLTFPASVKPHGRIAFTTWWENKGVAPVYKEYKFAIRLRNTEMKQVLVTDADLLTWLPGDIVYDDQLFLQHDMPEGTYELEIALVSPHTFEPVIKLAISGINDEGWYPMGSILVQR